MKTVFLPKPGKVIVLFIFVILIVWACQSSPDRDSFSITARARQTANPKSTAFLVQSQDALFQGNYLWALVFIDSAEKYAPDLADVHFERGNILFQVGQVKQAQSAYEKVAALDQYYRSVWFKLGNVAFQRKAHRKALEMYTKELAVADAENKALGREPETDRYCTTYLQLGRTYVELGVTDSAEMVFHEAIGLDSSFGEAWGDLAQLYKNKGDFEETLTYARKAFTLNPKNLDYNYLLGLILFRTGDMEAAVEHLRREVETRSYNPGAYYNLGRALIILGNVSEGQGYLDCTDSIRTLDVKIKLLQRTAEFHPNNMSVWQTLGDACYAVGRHEEAMQAYRNALFLDPVNLWAQHRMANLVLKAGDIQGAIHRYEVILEIEPQLTDVWVDLGVAHALRGEMVEARWVWRKAISLDPDNVLAKQYLEQGKIQP